MSVFQTAWSSGTESCSRRLRTCIGNWDSSASSTALWRWKCEMQREQRKMQREETKCFKEKWKSFLKPLEKLTNGNKSVWTWALSVGERKAIFWSQKLRISAVKTGLSITKQAVIQTHGHALTPGTLCSALLTPRMLSFTPGKIFQTCFALPIPKPAYAAQWESSLVFSGSLVLMHQVADFLISGYCACWECFTSQPRSHIGIKWASGAFIPASLSQMISLETNTEK